MTYLRIRKMVFRIRPALELYCTDTNELNKIEYQVGYLSLNPETCRFEVSDINMKCFDKCFSDYIPEKITNKNESAYLYLKGKASIAIINFCNKFNIIPPSFDDSKLKSDGDFINYICTIYKIRSIDINTGINKNILENSKIVKFGDIEFKKISSNISLPYLKININNKYYAEISFCIDNGVIFIRNTQDKILASSKDNIDLPKLCKFASANIVYTIIDCKVLKMISKLFGSFNYTIPNINDSYQYITFRNLIYKYYS